MKRERETMQTTVNPRSPGERVGRTATHAWVACGVLLLAFHLAAMSAPAGDEQQAIATSYGMAVHAFHTGDYQQSYDDLTNAIEAGSQDARAFYFRGLAALKLGRSDEAEADFAEGARLEADGRTTLPIARSLERVQGPDRLRLERYRARARVAVLQRAREAEALRYSRIREAQPDVLRRRRPESIPRGEVVAPGREQAVLEAEEVPLGKPAAEPAAEPADRSDPFGDEPEPVEDAKGDQVDERMEVEAAEVDDAADQRNQQDEARAAETDAGDDQRAERDEASGAGEPMVEEVKDDST